MPGLHVSMARFSSQVCQFDVECDNREAIPRIACQCQRARVVRHLQWGKVTEVGSCARVEKWQSI